MRIATAEDAARLLAPIVGDESDERLAIAYLDGERRVLHVGVETGDPAGAVLPLRRIAAEALRLGATGLVLAHNHPGGRAGPSDADLDATRRVAELARAIGLRLYDHLIFTGGGCCSLRAVGLL